MGEPKGLPTVFLLDDPAVRALDPRERGLEEVDAAHDGGQGIVQLVSNPCREGSHCSHFVRLNEDGFPCFQFLDHLIDGHGKIGELITETAYRYDGREVARGNPLGVDSKPLDVIQHTAPEQIGIQDQ